MSLLDTILEKIKQQRNLKDASIKIFKRNIERLAETKEIKDFNFLKDTKNIKSILALYKPETQNSILQSVNRVLEQLNDAELLDTYRKLYYEVHNNIRTTPSDIKTETQEKNWIDWNDILKKQNELMKKAVETQKWDDILNAFVLMLYTANEPRRNQDYLDMVIIRSKKYPYDEKLSKDKNYLLLKPNLRNLEGKYYFVFNKFKTAKSFGKQVFAVPTDIEVFFEKVYYPNYPAKKGKENALLVDTNGNALHFVNSITRILNKVFDKKIGASMLRHIYLTHKYGETYKEREIVSKKMSHTIGTQHKYIKKKD
jgi:hypothetical protein